MCTHSGGRPIRGVRRNELSKAPHRDLVPIEQNRADRRGLGTRIVVVVRAAGDDETRTAVLIAGAAAGCREADATRRRDASASLTERVHTAWCLCCPSMGHTELRRRTRASPSTVHANDARAGFALRRSSRARRRNPRPGGTGFDRRTVATPAPQGADRAGAASATRLKSTARARDATRPNASGTAREPSTGAVEASGSRASSDRRVPAVDRRAAARDAARGLEKPAIGVVVLGLIRLVVDAARRSHEGTGQGGGE